MYPGEAPAALAVITTANDGCPGGLVSRLTFAATAGTTYRILEDSTGAYAARDDDQGTLTLRLPDLTRPRVTAISPQPRRERPRHGQRIRRSLRTDAR